MVLSSLAGTAALNDALTTTNELLAAVLEELRETNGQRLELVATELRSLHEAVERMAASQG